MILLGYIVLNNNVFQNWLCGKATNYLSAQFNTKISIGRIYYNPFSIFALEQVYFGDQKKDTLFYVEKLRFNLGRVDLDSMIFELRNVKVEQGLCKITTYPDKTFNIDVLLDFVRKDTTPSSGPPFHLLMTDVECMNTRYMMIDSTEAFTSEGFDPYYEHMENLHLVAQNFHIINDSLNLDIKQISGVERSGFEIKKFSCNATITHYGMWFKNLYVETPYSQLGNSFSMKYSDWGTLPHYIDSVQMKGHLQGSHVDMRDIAFFAPVLKEYKQQYEVVNADFKGTVADFVVKNVFINYGDNSQIKGRVSITGMPDIDNCFIDAKLKEVKTNNKDIGYLTNIEMPKMMDALGVMSFNGDFTGFIHDFVAYGDFTTDLGTAQSDLNMKIADDVSKSSYSGSLGLMAFNIGKLIDQQKYVGLTTLQLKIKGEGFDLNSIKTSFKAKIDELNINRYNYKNIAIEGDLQKKKFNGELNINDTNLEVSFGGIIDFNHENPLYQFQATIDHAYLQPLNIDTSNTIVSASVDMNFVIKNLDNNKGYISVNDINCIKNGKDYRIEHVILQSDLNGTQRELSFQSDEVDCKMKGLITLNELPKSLRLIYSKIFPNYYHETESNVLVPQDFTYQINIKNTNVISSLFELNYSFTGLKVDGSINTLKNNLKMQLNAAKISYGDFEFNQIVSKVNTGKNDGEFDLNIANITEFDTIVVKSVNLNAIASLNKLVTRLTVKDSINHIESRCSANALFSQDVVDLTFDSSTFEFRGYPFHISKNSSIAFGRKEIEFKNLLFASNKQVIVLNGFYDFEGRHSLRSDLTNIDLSIINAIYRKSNVQYNGICNGALVLKGVDGVNYIDAFMNINALKLDNDNIGDFTINSNFNEKQKRFMVYAKSISGKLKNLEFGGYIETSQRPYQLNMNVAFDESPLNAFQAFLKDQLFVFEGNASAKCKVTGTFDDLAVVGKINLNHVKARVEYLKTVYSFETELDLEKDKVVINSTKLIDANGRTGLFEGLVTHHSFSDFALDISVKNLNRFKVLNTTFKDNSLYYGTGYVTGNMRIYGPVMDLVMDANFKTEPGTQFNIPLMTGGEGENPMMNFINTDTLQKNSTLTKITKLYGFSMNILLEITPDAEIQIIMDPINEDRIRGSGKGTLKMELTKQGQFNMYGGVSIEEGDYNFTVMKLWTRKFILKKGGTLLWAGDPLQANMDISGVYKVRKTSIADLLPYTDESSYNAAKSVKIPVECLMYLKGNLLSPEIKFDLNFPDLSTTLGANNVSLENSVTTLRNNPDMMNQQVVSLIVFSNFVPMNSATNVGGNLNSGVSNTISDLASKTLNKGIGKLIPGLDFNIDVQYGTQQKMAYIFSASKKLFNERLEVQASYDVVNYNQNFLTQYNIRKDGSLKLRAYNKTSSVTDPTNYKNITTQGLGLYYRKEFDQFSDLFKRKYNLPNSNTN